MCGFCGFASKFDAPDNTIITMTNSIKHRGPDAQKTLSFLFQDTYYGLGHNRLSIIDLDERSSQPFSDSDEETILLYNGEIYNYQELKKELFDYNFKTESDTEVILAGYKKYGLEYIQKLIGMFAIVLIDKKSSMIHLVRDRIGIKPLFYSIGESELLFSSEIEAITKFPTFKKNINLQSVTSLLSLKYIPSPYTVYENIKKVPPGTIISIKNLNSLQEIVYWDPIDEYDKNSLSRKKSSKVHHLEQLNNSIHNAVKRNMVSDVKVASLLSSGVDSSIVTSIASKHREISSFTIGFEDVQLDESNLSKRISEHLKITNTNKQITFDDQVATLLRVAELIDEPITDSSFIPTYLVSKLLNEHSYKVVLTGDGGDEIFYGYTHYDKYPKYIRIFKSISPIFKIINFAKKKKRPYSKSFINSGIIRYILSSFNDFTTFFSRLISGYNGFYAGLMLINDDSTQLINSIKFLKKLEKRNANLICSIYDLKVYLPDDMLTKVDRASMRNSLEARVPLLDHPVIENSFKFDVNEHKHFKTKKILLKRLLESLLPENLINKEKKGFNISTEKLLHSTKIKQRLFELSEIDYLENQKIFQIAELRNLISDYYSFGGKSHSFIWNFLLFQLWYDFRFLGNSIPH